MRYWFVIALLISFGLARSTFAADASKPNVIFILADDLGYGDLGCYGQQKIKTPNIDRLAAEGMRFTQHYAGSPVCGPSRTCLLGGSHTGHNFVRGNPAQASEKLSTGDTPLPASFVTFAKLFQQNGYRTAVIGKWGLGIPGSSGDPSKQGFDYFFGFANHGEAHNYYPDHLTRNDQKVPLDGKQYSHDLIAADALKFVRESAGKPFMLYFTPTIPHSKLQVPDIAPYGKEDWPQNEKKFAAMITRLDGDIGKLLDLLKELNIDQNTLVLFSSDNGPHKEGGHSPEFFDSNGPLRGIKRDVYDGGVRVPLLARWPAKIKANSTSDHISAFWDFLPTCADLLQVALPANIDGFSYLPTLQGSGEQKQHEALYWEFREQGGKQGLRMGNYKAVRLNVSSDAFAPIELYDVSTDISEQKNIADASPDVVEKAKALIDANHTPSKLFPLFPDEIKQAPKRHKDKKNKNDDEE